MKEEPVPKSEDELRPDVSAFPADSEEENVGQRSRAKSSSRRKRQDRSGESATIPENPTVPPPGDTHPPPPRKGEPVGQ
jgi:hypothetical protein